MLNEISLINIPNDIATLILKDYYTPILSLAIVHAKMVLTIQYPYINNTLQLPGPYYGYRGPYTNHIQYRVNKTEVTLSEFKTGFKNNQSCRAQCKHDPYFSIILEDRITINTKDHKIELLNNAQNRQQLLIMWTEYLKLCYEEYLNNQSLK